MKKILVTGAAGQIGSELVPALRERHGGENVIAAGHRTALPADVQESGPSIKLDVTSAAEVMKAVGELGIETIYHMSSILSALAESNRQIAYAVNINGTYNILEAAVSHNVGQVIIPSSIAAFGPDTPQENTPNETIQRPNTLYGISKVFGEHLGNYYHEKLGLDVRGLRLPGIIDGPSENRETGPAHAAQETEAQQPPVRRDKAGTAAAQSPSGEQLAKAEAQAAVRGAQQQPSVGAGLRGENFAHHVIVERRDPELRKASDGGECFDGAAALLQLEVEPRTALTA